MKRNNVAISLVLENMCVGRRFNVSFRCCQIVYILLPSLFAIDIIRSIKLLVAGARKILKAIAARFSLIGGQVIRYNNAIPRIEPKCWQQRQACASFTDISNGRQGDAKPRL